MGKKFKHWLTLNLARTRQTSAASDWLLGVDNTKGVGTAIREYLFAIRHLEIFNTM